MTDALLRAFLGSGTPAPLADLSTGTHAIVEPDNAVTVFNAHPDRAWTLTGAAAWPLESQRADYVWAVIAPTTRGLVVVNLSAVDISQLPDKVQWCLLTQQANHGLRALTPGGNKPRAVIRGDALTFSGSDRIVRIGTPYTATEDALRQQSTAAFSFLTPALQTVARIVAARGPISRKALAVAIYHRPTDKNRATLDMTLTRLRKHPRIALEKGADGMLTIAVLPEPGASADTPITPVA